MTRARRQKDIGVAVTGLPVGDEPVAFDAVAFRVDSLQQERNVRTRQSRQKAELVNELAASGIEPGSGIFASNYDETYRLVETVFSDEETESAALDDALFEETRELYTRLGTAELGGGGTSDGFYGKSAVLPLAMGALSPSTPQAVETDTGIVLDWEPLATRTGAASTYLDGSYRYIRIALTDEVEGSGSNIYEIRRVNIGATPQTPFVIHPDVATEFGSWPLNGVYDTGAATISLTYNSTTHVLFGAADPMTWTLEFDGRHTKVWRGVLREGELVVTTRAIFYSNCNYAEFTGRVTLSDSSSSNLTKSFTQLYWRKGSANLQMVPRRDWMYLFKTSAAPTQDFEILQSNTLGTYQSVPFSTYLLCGSPSSGIDLSTHTGILEVESGSTHPEVELTCGRTYTEGAFWGPRGLRPGRPTFYATDAAARSAGEALAISLRDTADPGSPYGIVDELQTFEYPPSSGGKLGDGINPWHVAYQTGAPQFVSALRIAAHQEWWRPIALLEASGDPIDHQSHPDLVIYQGLVFRPDLASNDGFGKSVGLAPATDCLGGWFPFDSAHCDLFYVLAYFYLSGDRDTGDMLDLYRELVVMENPTIARYQASSALGNQFLTGKNQTRDVRGVRTGLWIEHISPRTATRQALIDRCSDIYTQTGLTAITTASPNGGPFSPASNWWEQITGSAVGSLEVDTTSNALGTGIEALIYWQNPMVVDTALCLEGVAGTQVAQRMIDLAYQLCVVTLRDSPYIDTQTQGGRYHFITHLAWNGGAAQAASTLPPQQAYDVGNGNRSTLSPVNFRVAEDGLENWLFGMVAMVALDLASRYSNTALLDQTRIILDDWIGNGKLGTGWEAPNGSGAQFLGVAADGFWTNYPHTATTE